MPSLALAGVGITTAACSSDEDAAAASPAPHAEQAEAPKAAKPKPAKPNAAPVDPDVAEAARVVLLTERQQRDMTPHRTSATIDDSNVESMCVDAGVITRKLAKVEQRQRAVKRIVRTMDNPPSKALSALGDANEALSGLRSAADTLKTICGIDAPRRRRRPHHHADDPGTGPHRQRARRR